MLRWGLIRFVSSVAGLATVIMNIAVVGLANTYDFVTKFTTLGFAPAMPTVFLACAVIIVATWLLVNKVGVPAVFLEGRPVYHGRNKCSFGTEASTVYGPWEVVCGPNRATVPLVDLPETEEPIVHAKSHFISPKKLCKEQTRCMECIWHLPNLLLEYLFKTVSENYDQHMAAGPLFLDECSKHRELISTSPAEPRAWFFARRCFYVVEVLAHLYLLCIVGHVLYVQTEEFVAQYTRVIEQKRVIDRWTGSLELFVDVANRLLLPVATKLCGWQNDAVLLFGLGHTVDHLANQEAFHSAYVLFLRAQWLFLNVSGQALPREWPEFPTDWQMAEYVDFNETAAELLLPFAMCWFSVYTICNWPIARENRVLIHFSKRQDGTRDYRDEGYVTPGYRYGDVNVFARLLALAFAAYLIYSNHDPESVFNALTGLAGYIHKQFAHECPTCTECVKCTVCDNTSDAVRKAIHAANIENMDWFTANIPEPIHFIWKVASGICAGMKMKETLYG